MKTTDSLQRRFNQAAEQYKNNTALRKDDRVMTYSELLHCSETVRDDILRKYPGQIGMTVAILTENDSFFRFVGMLGVLKAGATYLPVDGSMITERTFYILENGDVDLLITEHRHADSVSQMIEKGILKESSVFFYDTEQLMAEERHSAVQDRETGPDRVAYVIYTSGSTGEPKGVEVQDQAVLNFHDGVSSLLGIGENDITLALSSFSFDASLFDMYPFLLNGGQIVLTPKEVKYSISSLNEYMIRHQVTIQCMTTALYHLFLSEENTVLKKLCVIGEKMMHFQEKSYRIYNMYGPTEATCLVTLDEITEQSEDIPAGYPLPGVDILILDQNRNPMKAGETGEIAITGTSLAKGYRNDPEKTRSRFVTLADGRMTYLTGDIGSLDRDGNLHCFGRQDSQVKYRGYRIELDEIRNNLLKHSAVRESCVLLYESGGNKYLVGACSTDGTGSEKELKEYLGVRLPEYMIPGRILLYPQLPLNRNGKIDRKKIESDFSGVMEHRSEESGRQGTAEKIRKIWAEILLIPESEIPDSIPFKELGGNSLQMLTMIVEVNKLFGVHLPVEKLIADASVRNIIRLIG